MQFDVKLPLLGFESVEKVELNKIDDVFVKMSVPGNESPTFTLIDPFAVREYSFSLPDQIKNLLDVNENSSILILNLVIVHTPIENSTINFAAPLVFNADNSTMAQVILYDTTEYDIAEPISKFLTDVPQDSQA